MKSLGIYLKPYIKESILAPIFKFLEVLFDLLVPVVVAQIIDVGIANNDHTYIVERFGVLLLMAGGWVLLAVLRLSSLLPKLV